MKYPSLTRFRLRSESIFVNNDIIIPLSSNLIHAYITVTHSILTYFTAERYSHSHFLFMLATANRVRRI